MPVVIHSHRRKKWLASGCRSSARCAWQRCRNTVTLTMVMWERPIAARIKPHHGRSKTPENRTLDSIKFPSKVQRFYVNPSKGQGYYPLRCGQEFPDLIHVFTN